MRLQLFSISGSSEKLLHSDLENDKLLGYYSPVNG